MLKKKLVPYGNSSALVINASLLQVLDVDPKETLVGLQVEGDCLVVRRVGNARRQPSKKRAAHLLVKKLESLQTTGLTREMFAQISTGQTLQEFTGNVIHRLPVDPATVARVEECFERQQTYRESLEATIIAVLARRKKQPDSRSARTESADAERGWECDGERGEAAKLGGSK